MITLIVLTWIFLFFPFSLDWSTYITLVIVRISFTIVWWLLIMLGIYIDTKRQKYRPDYFRSIFSFRLILSNQFNTRLAADG